jgi:hypothetical protein
MALSKALLNVIENRSDGIGLKIGEEEATKFRDSATHVA